jgi:hypothetical protein
LTTPVADGTVRIAHTEEPMTADTANTAHFDEPPPMFCYRHPDRETWVRCGRCDQPICTACAMQGPVGLRCKQCGKPVRDALSSLRPRQLLIALAVAIGGSAIVGYLGLQIGFFMILLGFFAGGFIAEGIDRAVGIKRGPRMLALVIGGIVIGGLLGSGLSLLGVWREIVEFREVPGFGLGDLILEVLPQILIAIGATAAGAYGRMR